jgi:hypothetical protein
MLFIECIVTQFLQCKTNDIVISGSLSSRHGTSSMFWMEEWPSVWRVAANILNKQSWTADKGLVLQLGGLGRC